MNVERDVAVDFVKGACVVAMLAHHTLNYFPLEIPLIKWFRFVSGAFVFTSGLIVTRYYLKRYCSDRKWMYLRLLARSCKILVLFALANLVMDLLKAGGLGSKKPSFDGIHDALLLMFLTGDYRVLHFELLVPIAYTLMLCAVLIRVLGKHLWLLGLLAVAFLFFCAWYTGAGVYYCRYTALGLTGAAIGLLPETAIQWIQRLRLVLWSLYVVYSISLPWLPLAYPVYVGVVMLNIAFLYDVGNWLPQRSYPLEKLILLGKYSLVSYFAQILILQVLTRLLDYPAASLGSVFVAFILATTGTLLFVVATDRSQRRFGWVAFCYRLVFG